VSRVVSGAAAGAAALMMLACSAPAPGGGAEGGDPAATVRFTEPAEDATVASPFQVCMELAGLTLAPAGDVVAGTGHLHVIVDPTAEEMSQFSSGEPNIVPKDETHLHLGDGSQCVTVEAAAGEHSLLAVVTDGVHAGLDPAVTAQMSVTVAQ
jgi:hypothetical protein